MICPQNYCAYINNEKCQGKGARLWWYCWQRAFDQEKQSSFIETTRPAYPGVQGWTAEDAMVCNLNLVDSLLLATSGCTHA